MDARPAGWAQLVVWSVVNLVALLQAAGFATRTIDPEINRQLGWAIIALALPATLALGAFIRSGAGWRDRIGPLAFDLFVVVSLVLDHWLRVEFRNPRQPAILVPYLVLFFGSIALMGFPMYRRHRGLWLITVVTSAALLVSMGIAMSSGVG